MDQKFEGTPQAEIRLEGRKVIRSEVKDDWGSRLQWVVRHNGETVATAAARAENFYEHPEPKPGKYEVVLEMWHYIDYKKDKDGNFVNSKFVEVSNKVSFTV